MPNSLTANGLVLATRAELLTNMTTAMQTIYGSDINLSSDSPDGQALNLFVQAIGDVQDLVMAVFTSFDPDQAIGNALDQRCGINGIQRQGSTYSTTNITLVVTKQITLYGLDQTVNTPYTVTDNAGNQWVLLVTQTLAAGTYALLFRAANSGPVLATVNTITAPVTYVLGISSISNLSSQVSIGLAAETDAAFRIRRQGSTSLASSGFADALRAALKNVSGVTSSFVYENNTGSTDANGVPPRAIWVIVSGTAASADIANAIYKKRGGGVFMKGSIQYNVTQSDGTLFPVYWDTVSQVPVYVKFTATSIDGINQPNVALILSLLGTTVNGVSYLVPGVAAQVNTNQLVAAVQAIDPNCLVTNAGFSTALNGTYTPTLLVASKNQQFTIASANIIVTPITISPPSLSIGRGSTRQFAAAGGVGTKTFSFVTNASGGTITSAGFYTAGSSIGTDVIQVTDTAATPNTTQAVITVS